MKATANKPNKFRLKREAMCLKLLKSGISRPDVTFFGRVLDRVGGSDIDKFMWILTKGIQANIIGHDNLSEEDMALAKKFAELKTWQEAEAFQDKIEDEFEGKK